MQLRLAGAVIEHLPWRDCVVRYGRAETLFFLDPPYWQVEGYGVEFGLPEYGALAGIMRSIKGKALLTVNDHPAMREVFAGLRTVRVSTRYTLGASAASRSVPRGELVVRSW